MVISARSKFIAQLLTAMLPNGSIARRNALWSLAPAGKIPASFRGDTWVYVSSMGREWSAWLPIVLRAVYVFGLAMRSAQAQDVLSPAQVFFGD